MMSTSGRGVFLCIGPGEESQTKPINAANEAGAHALKVSFTPAAFVSRTVFEVVAYCGSKYVDQEYRVALAARSPPIIPLL